MYNVSTLSLLLIGLITIFDAILTDRQSGQKLQCLYMESDGNFDFGKSYLPLDSHTNTVIPDRFTYPSKWR